MIAESTLIPNEDTKLVNIHIVKPDITGSTEKIKNRTWLHDILDDNDIPYHIEIRSFSPSSTKTIESQWIFVEEKHAETAKDLFKQYIDPKSLSFSEEEIEGEKDKKEEEEEDEYNGIPQKKCPSCDENVDFDYFKCPFCKAALS